MQTQTRVNTCEYRGIGVYPCLCSNQVSADRPLQLRLNSNLPQAVALLRQHHGSDCWVDSTLEAVWSHMAASSPPTLFVFELWYGDEMIAADFAHPTANGR